MRWLIRILVLVFVICLILAAIAFLGGNADDYQLKFLDWELLTQSVGELVLLAFVLGAFAGLLSGVPVILRLQRQTKKMQKRLSQKQNSQEVAS